MKSIEKKKDEKKTREKSNNKSTTKASSLTTTKATVVGKKTKKTMIEIELTKKKKKKETEEKGRDGDSIDDIFGKAKKTMATATEKTRTTAADEKKKKNKEEEFVRILLPGEKKPKGKRVNAKGEEVPEFVPVEKPRRVEEGLPVYKSYDDFTDMKHGQQKVDSRGRVLGPNGEPGGKCPFDCWCCF